MLCPKSVLITGSNRGIGLELVKHFLRLETPPKCVFACCRNPDKAEELQAVAKDNAAMNVVQLDVKDVDSIKAAKRVVEERLSGAGLNLLINNAAAATRQGLNDVTKDTMMELYEVNTVGPLMIVQTFIPLLKQAVFEQPDGQMSVNRSAIVNMSTGVASISENSSGGAYPYRCSKAALNMVTSNLSIDLKSDGILCSAIHPGWVKTEMGGPNALISTDESATNIMTTIAKLHGEDENGKFYHAVQHRVLGW